MEANLLGRTAVLVANDSLSTLDTSEERERGFIASS